MFDQKQTKSELDSAVDSLKNDFKAISTGRATPTLLDTLSINAYGSQTPVANIASITVEDARTLRVSPWDKAHVTEIEKSITDSGMPFSVVTDSNGLRVIVPMMTEENRKKITKHLRELHEEARVRIRHAREKANKSIDESEKAGEFAQDDNKRIKAEVQKMVDDTNKKLDEILSEKESEIMTI